MIALKEKSGPTKVTTIPPDGDVNVCSQSSPYAEIFDSKPQDENSGINKVSRKYLVNPSNRQSDLPSCSQLI